jgi:signal transduction histidine kinase
MMLNPSYWRAIRECCPDEAAFTRLQDILTTRLVQAFKLKDPDRETARYAAIAHAIPDLLFRIRRDGLYLDAEAIAEQDFAIPPDAMIGKTVYDLLPRDIAQQRMYYVALALNTGALQTYEYSLFNHGELRYYEARIAVCGLDEVMLIARDITQRKLSEDALQKSLQEQANLYQQVQQLNQDLERLVKERTAQLQQKMIELQELNQQKDDFLNAVFHDLRTPLTGMLLVLQNLYTKTDADPIPVSRSLIERMGDSGARQLQLMDALLEAHFSEVRGIPLNCVALDVVAWAAAIAQDLAPLVHQNQATLVNQITPAASSGLPRIWADPHQLRRVLENLITNALKHNPPGVQISLMIEPAPASPESAMVKMWVIDNGVGLAAEDCTTLFERYARGTKARRSSGIGLGLYLCRQIVLAHGGNIGVVSTPGQGAKFWFTLPAASGSVSGSGGG